MFIIIQDGNSSNDQPYHSAPYKKQEPPYHSAPHCSSARATYVTNPAKGKKGFIDNEVKIV